MLGDNAGGRTKLKDSHFPISELTVKFSDRDTVAPGQGRTHRSVEQNREFWNKLIYGQQTSDKRAKTISVSVNGAGTSGQPQARKWSWTHPAPHTEINSKWVRDPNVNADTIKLLEENRNESSWPWIGKGFLHDTKCLSNKRKNKYIGFHQNLKLLCFKGHHPESKDNGQLGENIGKSDTWTRTRI